MLMLNKFVPPVLEDWSIIEFVVWVIFVPAFIVMAFNKFVPPVLEDWSMIEVVVWVKFVPATMVMAFKVFEPVPDCVIIPVVD